MIVINDYATIYTDTIGLCMYKTCRICNQNQDIKLFYKRQLDCIKCWNEKRRLARPLSKCKHCNMFYRSVVQGRYKFCTEKCRFMNKVKMNDENGCWIWQGHIQKKKNGYGTFVPVGEKSGLAHRSSYKLFVGYLEDNLHVLHTCDVPYCVAPHHLIKGTHQDNMNDMLQKGRDNRAHKGQINPSAKLTEQDVIDIRKTYKETNCSYVYIAKLYGVTPETISAIIKRLTWKHV